MPQLIPILLYHSVSVSAEPRYRRYCISPEQFGAHVRYLSAEGYQPLSVSALVSTLSENGSMPRRPVVLTFDDGLLDFYEGALPILADAGFPATLYVVSGLVGRRAAWLRDQGEGSRPLMSWAQLREAINLGVECGAHGRRHRVIDLLPEEEARREIIDPRTEMEDRLGRAIGTFAYPYGYHTRSMTRMVHEAGYGSACAVRHAISHVDDDRFALARILVPGDLPVEQLGAWLAGRQIAVARPGERFRTTAWRQVRRWSAALRSSRGAELGEDDEEQA